MGLNFGLGPFSKFELEFLIIPRSLLKSRFWILWCRPILLKVKPGPSCGGFELVSRQSALPVSSLSCPTPLWLPEIRSGLCVDFNSDHSSIFL